MAARKVKLLESDVRLKLSDESRTRDESEHRNNATEVPPSNTLTQCCLCTSAMTSLSIQYCNLV